MELDAWIARRLNKPVTPSLGDLIEALWIGGFGWFEATENRLEFGRSLDDDIWEEVIVWLRASRAGRLGFARAAHFIRYTTGRTGSLDEAYVWALTPREGVLKDA